MIAIVCGGRDYTDYEHVCRQLDALGITFVIHGGARGADALAQRWALDRGIPFACVPAHWDRYSKAAGAKRNGWMLRLKPEMVVAFPGGRGTANMVEQAVAAGIDVRQVATGA